MKFVLPLFVLTALLTLGSLVAADENTPPLTAAQQVILSQNATNLALLKNPKLTDQVSYTLDPQQLALAKIAAEKVLNTIYVSNYAPPSVDSARDVRLTSWNLNYGAELGGILNLVAPQSDQDFACVNGGDGFQRDQCQLHQTDIFILNEADRGVCRSGSVSVTDEIARKMKMNAAYLPEFFEAEPDYHGLKDQGVCAPPKTRGALTDNLTGNAILSRYPMTNLRALSLPRGKLEKGYCWSWLDDEAQKNGLLERAQKQAVKTVFKNDDLRRQLRYGGRAALVADIELPQHQFITVVAVHLEDMAEPSCRKAQMAFLLGALQANPYPIVYAGDFNTSGHKLGHRRLVSTAKDVFVAETAKNPAFYANLGFYSSPVGLAVAATKSSLTFLTNHRNPTRKNLFLLRENSESGLFELLKKDGILWQGDAPWAATNERAKIGFKGTAYLERPIGPLGEAKLDWIFFKPASGAEIAPKMPHTLEALRKHLGSEFPSDHVPISLVLAPKNP